MTPSPTTPTPHADHVKHLTRVWLALIGLTLLGGYLGETAEAGWAITLVVAGVVAIKGRLVLDHFMELAQANRRIRKLMRLYFYVMPALVLGVHLFSDLLARLTAIR